MSVEFDKGQAAEHVSAEVIAMITKLVVVVSHGYQLLR